MRRLQLTELEILKAVDSFCREQHIRYSLYCGTLLGAVRHQGFIPWDDDLDICMEREEYDRFVALWTRQGPAGYILQNKENTTIFTQTFTKIRKGHTTFLQQGEDGTTHHTGIFIDVFPIDRIPNGKWKQKLYKFRCMCYLLYTREFIPPKEKSSLPQRAASAFLLAIVPKNKRTAIRRKLLAKLTQYNADKNLKMVSTASMKLAGCPQSPDWLDKFVDLPFEDGKFPCCAGWDGFLQSFYGDFRQLPPKGERSNKHAPQIVDFEKSYDEIQV